MDVCIVNGCSKPRLTKGYCNGHYKKLLRYGTPVVIKQCEVCKKEYEPAVKFQRFCSDTCVYKHRAHLPSEKENRKKYLSKFYKTDKGKALMIKNRKEMYWKHHEKELARMSLRYAVRKGKIVKPKHCSKCGKEGKIDGHHHNGYENRLDVVWLCRSCHVREHSDIGA